MMLPVENGGRKSDSTARAVVAVSVFAYGLTANDAAFVLLSNASTEDAFAVDGRGVASVVPDTAGSSENLGGGETTSGTTPLGATIPSATTGGSEEKEGGGGTSEEGFFISLLGLAFFDQLIDGPKYKRDVVITAALN